MPASTRKLRGSLVSLTAKTFNNEASKGVVAQDPNLMTLLQRFEYFPRAFQNVMRDVRIYFLIQDALTTRRNQWTAKGRPPVWVRWKQQRLRKELAWIVPLAGACMLPIIGYIPSFLAFAFPRQMLTRHFWNEYELEYFESTALAMRHHYQKLVCDYWWDHYSEDMERLLQNHNSQEVDLVDLSQDKQHPPAHWKHVAQAAGCFSFFPNDDGTWKIFLFYWKLQAQVHLDQLVVDDTLLLNALYLQDSEIQQACRVRGLSVDRHALELYLNLIIVLRKRTLASDWGLISLLASGSGHRRQLMK